MNPDRRKEKENMKKRIISVSREFGSGGRELGKRLADNLGFAYYDREIVLSLAEQTGMDENSLEQQLEIAAPVPFSIHFAQSFSDGYMVNDSTVQLLSLQTRLIKELAAKGDCVIVGRGADAILEDEQPFRLFVYAEKEAKLARCRSRAAEGEILSDKDILRRMKQIDKRRAEFHDIISSRPWGDKESYDLCVNTTGTEIKVVVPAVAEYYRRWAALDR